MAGVKVRGEIFHCNVCGNVVGVTSAGGGELVCCGKPMELQIEKTTEAGTEKHLPVLVLKNNVTEVMIGEIPHPMEIGHHIEWVEIQSNRRIFRYYFSPGDEPKVDFIIENEKILSVRAYCNVHGLWSKAVENQV